MLGTSSPVRIVKLVGRAWPLAVGAAVLALLLLPSTAPERTTEAAVQQPFQCRPPSFWDVFILDSSGDPDHGGDQIVNDTAPRNNYNFITGVEGLGFSVPARQGVKQNDTISQLLVGKPWRVVLISAPTHAQDFVLNTDGSYSWMPVAGYRGADSFVYSYASGTECHGSRATVTIPPVGGRLVDDTFTVFNDRPFTTPQVCSVSGCGVLYNDDSPGAAQQLVTCASPDLCADAVIGIAVATAAGNAVLVDSFGTLQFTPRTDIVFEGSVSFFYQTNRQDIGDHTTEDGPKSAGRVTLNVKSPPVTSVFYTPVSIDDGASTPEDTPLTITPAQLLANDVGANFVSRLFNGPAHGSLQLDQCTTTEVAAGLCFPLNAIQSIIYTPQPNFVGIDAFQYEALNTSTFANGAGNATVHLAVSPVPDLPVLVNDTFTVPRGEPAVLRVLDNDTDIDAQIDPSTLRQECCAPGGNAGSLSIDNGTFAYTPDGSEPTKQFAYLVNTISGQSLQAAVFTVNVDPNPATNDNYSASEDTPLTIPPPGVLANDIVATGASPPLDFPPQFGAVDMSDDGSFVYRPRPNFVGIDTFGYSYNGDTAIVTITVNPVPDAPAVVLNIAACPEGLICVDRPDPDGRVDLDTGDVARLRGLIADPEHGHGTIEIDWGDGEKTTRSYPCAFAEVPCLYTLAENQSWYPPTGLCGALTCNNAVFFEFGHFYDGQPPPDGLRYDITVTATSFGENLTGSANTFATLADGDEDGTADQFDNCPSSANADQADFDEDGVGDACDDDDDGDGVLDTADNCQFVVNADQANNDGDAQGDACDRDDDNDGVLDDFAIGFDNCQFVANSDQTDTDDDNEGDACDPDDDNDGVVDTADNCRVVVNSGQANNDSDSAGDACDSDDDNDNVVDMNDNCQFAANTNQANFDGDAQGDGCDNNDDNDALPDSTDVCDLEVPQGGLDADVNGCTDTIARLQQVVAGLSIPKGTKNGLLGTLGSAQKAYNSGKIPQAESKLREFIVQVQAQRGKGLTNAQADLLVAYANNIIVLI